MAVGVDHALVLPAMGAFRQMRGLHLAGADENQRLFAVHAIAVDVDVLEVEIGSQGLQLPEVDDHRVRVPQPDLLQRGPIGGEFLCRQLVVAGGLAPLDLVEVEPIAREGEMILDERVLAFELLRLHHEELVDVRVEAGDRQANQEQPDERQGRDDPAGPADVDLEEEEAGDHRRGHELVGDEAGIGVGEAKAGDDAAFGIAEEVQFQDHAPADEDDEGKHQNGDVQVDLEGDLGARRLRADAAEEVARQDGEDERHEDADERPALHQRVEGEMEHEVAEIALELGGRCGPSGRHATTEGTCPSGRRSEAR
jgi:hypothetical protein